MPIKQENIKVMVTVENCLMLDSLIIQEQTTTPIDNYNKLVKPTWVCQQNLMDVQIIYLVEVMYLLFFSFYYRMGGALDSEN